MFIEQLVTIINGASQIGWVLFGLLCLVSFVRLLFQRGPVRALRFLISLPVLLTAVLLMLFSALSFAVVYISPEKVAVVPSIFAPRGIRPQALGPGFHLIVPFLEKAIEYPTYWQTFTMSGTVEEDQTAEGNEIIEASANTDHGSIRARTSDGQEVFIDCSVIFRIDQDQTVLVHVDWQNRYRDAFIRPVVRGGVRTQVSQFTVDEINSSERIRLENLLTQQLKEQLARKGFILDQFILRDITFSPEFARAIEQKQVALEGQVQRQYEAEQIRLLASGRADAELIQSRARARSLEVVGAALERNPALLNYYYIDRLSSNIQVMLLPAGQQFFLPLPELKASGALSSTISLTATNALSPTALLPTLPQPAGGASGQP